MEETEYQTMYRAEDRHWWYAGLHDLVLRSLPAGRNDLSIFDAGCGTGRLMQLMQQRGTVRGCDASPTAVGLCRERGMKSVICCDLNALRLAPYSLDIITSIDVLCHRAITDDRAVLEMFHTALAPSGLLILQVPAYEWLRSTHDVAVHTARRYTKRALVTMLRRSGFRIVQATYRVSLPFVPIAAWRMARSLLAPLRRNCSGSVSSDVAMPPEWLNALLRRMMAIENQALTRTALPFGTSLFVIARKA